MTSVADLGWFMVRCSITKDECELTICEPASEDSPASSLTLTTIDAILRLRDCIDEEVAQLGERVDLEDPTKDS